MVKGELIYHDAPKTEKSGCPYCGQENIRWAELMNGTYWKQCEACGMIYVGHDINQEEIDNEVSLQI
jgi:hypothetical protein